MCVIFGPKRTSGVYGDWFLLKGTAFNIKPVSLPPRQTRVLIVKALCRQYPEQETILGGGGGGGVVCM